MDEESDHYNSDGSLDRAISDENWDTPAIKTKRNPEIDSDDDDWDGYEDGFPKKLLRVKEKIYVEDEDWMFEDYYEEFDLDEESNHCNSDASSDGTILDENWDLVVCATGKDPEIDSADEEWCGYEETFPMKRVKKKVYFEDWMFEDYYNEHE
ncbi:uncharacterized protein LOC130450947 isoform X2 [Diorhabda sublineata]|uniref:uncharacterized protein LOC130450947 isoform X2 n=1 Tax=Diorhabda sublineata TaxID=1163346 RepID=UPI0024E135D6|nr:uncharacterized protein LOC130450947 isoform X2 [Diorhabda sublineata]XP_056645676.1 uncharacterized protein LOC130450947 isoform X2 [Diorhabda sublineata]